MFNPTKLVCLKYEKMAEKIFQPEFPPEAEKILPADVWAKLQEIKGSSATIHEKRCQIHQLMMTVPDEIMDKMPEPKEFASLPADVGNKTKINN